MANDVNGGVFWEGVLRRCWWLVFGLLRPHGRHDALTPGSSPRQALALSRRAGPLHNYVIPAKAGIQRGGAIGDPSETWPLHGADDGLCKGPRAGEGTGDAVRELPTALMAR